MSEVLALFHHGCGIKIAGLFFALAHTSFDPAMSQSRDRSQASNTTMPSTRAVASATIKSPARLLIDDRGARLTGSDSASVTTETIWDQHCETAAERQCRLIVFNLP
jgi:hypothetical protein